MRWPVLPFRYRVRCIMPDLTNADVLALAKASSIDIPDDLITEVRESLNGLLEA